MKMPLASLAFIVALLLQACGGGTTGDPDDPPSQSAVPMVAGRVVDGSAEEPTSVYVRVKGSAGLDRSVAVVKPAAVGYRYEVSVSNLTGPFLLTNSDSDQGTLFSVATVAGVANITPFTTLLVVDLLGSDPAEYFRYQDGRANGGFPAVTRAQIDEAQARVRRKLKREYGFDGLAGVGDFVTAPFEAKPGDATFNAIKALNQTLADRGTDLLTVVNASIAEAARCRQESVLVTIGGVGDPFCPSARRNDTDEIDATVQVLSFRNQRGDALTVRVRGSDVLTARYLTLETAAFECSGAGCSGITLGQPAGNGSRQVTLAGASLSGASGLAVLSGNLLSAVPGLTLDCPTPGNRFVLTRPGLPLEGYCAGSEDGFGFGAVGNSRASGARRIYTFSSFNGDTTGPMLEVQTLGDSVYSMLLYSADPDTGLYLPLFQCRGGTCTGAALGPVTVDTSQGSPIELRSITLQGAVLSAVLPDGSSSTTESVSVDAELRTYYYGPDPSVPPLLAVACAPTAPTVSVQVGESNQPLAVCAPDDTQGFQLSGSFLDEFGNVGGYFIANLFSDGVGTFTTGNGVNVFVSGGVVQRVSFDSDGVTYVCVGSECAGVSISAPNGAGETNVSFGGTLLQELGTADLRGDRTVTLNGNFVAPPP